MLSCLAGRDEGSPVTQWQLAVSSLPFTNGLKLADRADALLHVRPGQISQNKLLQAKYRRLRFAHRTFSTSTSCHELDASTTTDQQSPLSVHIRSLMRQIPHPVVVITSSSPSTPGDLSTSIKRGITVSSLTTVTLDPTPIFSFNIRRPSTTLNALYSSRQFMIHFVRATAQGARIADAFTKGNAAQAFRSLAREGVGVLEDRGKRGRPPILAGKDVMKVIRCEMIGMGVEVEDHVIILGKVVGVLMDSSSDAAASKHERELGLLYVNKGYRSVGKNINLEVGTIGAREGIEGINS